MYRVTWKSFDTTSLELVEDPIGTGQMSIESFINTYSPLLETLDGRDMSSYMDFYFERSVCNASILVFVDENAKLDFRDEAILMGLIPELTEIMEGETVNEKKLRESVKYKAVQKQKILKNNVSWLEKQQKTLISAQKSLDVLEKKLIDEKDESKRLKIQTKIDKIIKLLADSKHNSC